MNKTEYASGGRWFRRVFMLLVILILVFTPVGVIVNPHGVSAKTPGQSDLAHFTQIQTNGNSTSSTTQVFLPFIDKPGNYATTTVFAAIGDYGTGNGNEGQVASLIQSWHPDFVITLGDNNYPDGSADHIDAAIGQFFHTYIFPYLGGYGQGSPDNEFFPTLGNHDLMSSNGQPYYNYFALPHNERYYDFVQGPVHFFALNSNDSEPDGVNSSSIQAAWLQQGLVSSTSPWNIVYMHQPPYSSGEHGSSEYMRWPFLSWGADAVLSGHDHTYERLLENGMTYFVNGLGGASIYNFGTIIAGSQVHYNGDYGAMHIAATNSNLRFQFINTSGQVIDQVDMNK